MLENVQKGFKLKRKRKRANKAKQNVNSMELIPTDSEEGNETTPKKVKFSKSISIGNNNFPKDDLDQVYKNLEKRVLKDNKPRKQYELIGGVYSAGILKFTKKPSQNDAINWEDFEETERGKFHLPDDGSIFIEGIPFHHLVLKELKEKHLLRLRQNGIEINRNRFLPEEDEQLRKNWHSFAKLHSISEDEAPAYFGIETVVTSAQERAERLKFIHENNFRPFMCKKLLNRSCPQVFRRCYILFHPDNKIWSKEDDVQLLKLAKKYGLKWEKIGHKMTKKRFDCQKRYSQIYSLPLGGDNDEIQLVGPIKWSNIETSKLYEYLRSSLVKHPVLVATLKKYEYLEAEIDWCEAQIKLPNKTALQCQLKWKEIKKKLQEAKESLQTDNLEQIE